MCTQITGSNFNSYSDHIRKRMIEFDDFKLNKSFWNSIMFTNTELATLVGATVNSFMLENLSQKLDTVIANQNKILENQGKYLNTMA